MELPSYIDQDAWDGYVELRLSLNKKAWTPRAEKLALMRLENFYLKGLDVNAILDQSTAVGWRGLFPLKEVYEVSNPNYRGSPSRRDQARSEINNLAREGQNHPTGVVEVGKLRAIKRPGGC